MAKKQVGSQQVMTPRGNTPGAAITSADQHFKDEQASDADQKMLRNFESYSHNIRTSGFTELDHSNCDHAHNICRPKRRGQAKQKAADHTASRMKYRDTSQSFQDKYSRKEFKQARRYAKKEDASRGTADWSKTSPEQLWYAPGEWGEVVRNYRTQTKNYRNAYGTKHENDQLNNELLAPWAEKYSAPMSKDKKITWTSPQNQRKDFKKFFKTQGVDTGLKFKYKKNAGEAEITTFLVPQGWHKSAGLGDAAGMANHFNNPDAKGKAVGQQWQLTTELHPQYQSTRTHELGHALGLSHPIEHQYTEDHESIMSWNRNRNNNRFGMEDLQALNQIHQHRSKTNYGTPGRSYWGNYNGQNFA